MGRLFGVLAFFVFFIIFAIFKIIANGAKDAYKKVFNIDEKNKQAFFDELYRFMAQFCVEKIEQKTPKEFIINDLATMVGSFGRSKGYDLSVVFCREVAEDFYSFAYTKMMNEKV